MPGVSAVGGKLIRHVALLVAVASCGRNYPGNEDSGPQLRHVILQPLSEPVHNVFPATSVTLRVVALRSAGTEIESREDLQPASGETIAWRILGSNPTGALSSPATVTDEAGISNVVVEVGVTTGVNLLVEASTSQAPPVTFTIRVNPEERRLEPITATSVATSVGRQELLRVRLVRVLASSAYGAPLPNEIVPVEFVGGPRTNGAKLAIPPGGYTELATDSAGVASVRFETGSTPQSGYEVIFCPGTSCPSTSPLTITIDVAERSGSGSECTFFTDCDPGFVCEGGMCSPAELYCDNDAQCPTGYMCDPTIRQCVVDEGEGCIDDDECDGSDICGPVGCCVPEGACLSDDDCPEGWTCDACSGACLPGSSATDALDVRGAWQTSYHFDISDTLPGFFTNGLGPVVDFLNLTFHDQLDIGIPIIGDIIEDVIQSLIAEYVPPWVGMVVEALADFIHAFENMEVEGDMFLVQTPETPVLGTDVSGEEEWTSATFYIVSLCSGGPAEFETNPSCASIDVVLDNTIPLDYSNDDLRAGVRVDPFIGQVLGDTLRFYGRYTEVGLRQIVNVMLDLIVAVASNSTYANFESFLIDIVPCTDLQYAIDDLVCSITDGSVCSVPGIELLCEAAAITATAELEDAMGQLPAELELQFDARALIHDIPLGGQADILGAPEDPTNTAESALIGNSGFEFFGGDLDGDSWWYGVR